MALQERLEGLQVLRLRRPAAVDHERQRILEQVEAARRVVVAVNDGGSPHLADRVEDRVERRAEEARRAAADLFRELLLLEVELAEPAPDAGIEADHELDVVPGTAVLEIEGAHQRVQPRAIFFGEGQELVRDQHVLDRVVVEHRPVGLRVVDGGERAVDRGIVGDGDGEPHHHRPAHLAVHHLQQLGHRRALRLEVLDVPVRVVEETSGRVLRRSGSSGEGEDQQCCPDETCVCVSHGGGTVGPLRAPRSRLMNASSKPTRRGQE